MTVFAFFGIGPMEIVVLMLLGVIIMGLVLTIVLRLTTRRSNLPSENYVATLERENDELREEIERLKRRQDADH